MRYQDSKVHSVAELIDFLKRDAMRLQNEFEDELAKEGAPVQVPVWFRGLTDAKWPLVTTMARKPGVPDEEQALMNRFKQNAGQFLNREPGEWEWMFLMRHHGLPSRLLDWTESSLIGLYFAVTPILSSGASPEDIERHDRTNGVIWCLLPTELNKRSALYSRGEFDIPMFEDEDSNSTVYLPKSLGLAGGIKAAAGMGMRQSTRMQAQQGVFVVTHGDQTPIEKTGDRRHVWRYIVPARSKKDIRKELKLLGVTPLTVFPELDSVALAARRDLDV